MRPRRRFAAALQEWVSAAAALVLVACVGSPRSRSELAHADEGVRFEGVVTRNDQPVVIESYDYQLQAWLPLTTIDELVAVADPLGTHYRFSADLTLPTAREQWAPGKTSRSMRTQLRALQGAHVLASFETDADACLRRAQASTKTLDDVERALRKCQAPGSPALELMVASCGEVGQSCCDHVGSNPSELCAPELSCEHRRCRVPSYPVPMIAGHSQDVAVPRGGRVREAWLELNDRSVGSDTRVSLIAKHAPAPGVTVERSQADVVRLRFDLPLWQPGVNRSRVVALIEHEGKVSELTTPFTTLRYEPGVDLGRFERGAFALPARHFPMFIRDCRSFGCKDADGDGLNDLWENVALHQLRPRLLMDGDDHFFQTKDAVRVISSVVPLTRDGQQYLFFAHVVTFSRDYGPPVLRGTFGLDHAGDTEAAGLAFTLEADGKLRWAATVAKGHDCLTCKPSWHWFAQDWDGDGAPLLYVEENKHGLWQSGKQCRAESAFDCEGDRPLRPEIVNAGDFHEDGAIALVDALDRVRPDGPHGALAQVFPGEVLWSAARAPVTGRFCGGRHKGCTQGRSAAMPGKVIGDLVRRFQGDRW